MDRILGIMDEGINRYPTINREKVVLIFVAVIVFLIHIAHVGSIGIFTVLDDEFGYWGNAAYLAGLDWSDIVSEIPYYSYGYSLLLVPFFWVFNSPFFMYKAAVILNGIFISTGFLLCYDMAKRLLRDTDRVLLIAIAFLISMYPTYIAYSNIAWAECLLIFTCWLLTWCFVDLSKESSTYKFILIGFLSMYAYIIHQRSIGILVAGILTILIMKVFNKINWKQVCFVFLPIILLTIAHLYLKNDIQSHLWLNASGNLTNDYADQFSKIYQLMTIDGLARISAIFMGQFFYLGAASYLLSYFGLYQLLTKIVSAIKIAIKRGNPSLLNSDANFYLYVFLLSALSLSLIISVVFMINPTRADHIIYGRYTDMILGPVMLLGFALLYDKQIVAKRMFSFICLSFIILTVVVHLILIQFNLKNLHLINAIGLLFMGSPLSVFLPAAIAVLASRIVYFSQTKARRLTCLVALSLLFLFTGESIAKSIVNWNQDTMKINGVAKIITEDNNHLPIYFLWHDQDNPNYGKWDNRNTCDRLIADCYQFILKDREIKIVKSKELQTIDEDKFILSSNLYSLFDLMEDNTFCASAVGSFLLVPKNSDLVPDSHPQNVIVIPLDTFNIKNAIYNGNYIKGNGSEGIILQGSNKLNEGKYQFTVNGNLISYQDNNLGYVDVKYSLNDIILNRVNLTNSGIDQNQRFVLQVPFEVDKDQEYIELRVYANDGTQLQLNNVWIERI